MKKILSMLCAALFIAACSTPKYTYHFDHYDYNSGKNKTALKMEQKNETINVVQEPLSVDETTLVASAKEDQVYVSENAPTKTSTRKEVFKKLKTMSKEEIKELKKEVKKYVKEGKNIADAQARPSGDLKLAIIFGVVGIVLMIVLGDLLWLGSIAILIGLFFLVRWLINN